MQNVRFLKNSYKLKSVPIKISAYVIKYGISYPIKKTLIISICNENHIKFRIPPYENQKNTKNILCTHNKFQKNIVIS